MNVSDALEIERGIVFKQGYCKEKSLQKVALSKEFRVGIYQPTQKLCNVFSSQWQKFEKSNHVHFITSAPHHSKGQGQFYISFSIYKTYQNNFEVKINIV